MHYSITVESVATGAVVGTFKTLLALIAANTTGYRGRLRKLKVTPSGEAPVDSNVLIKVSKTNNATAGTPGSSPTNLKKKDAASRASIMTAGINYTAEPTTVDSDGPFLSEAINGRGGFSESWSEEEAPRWGPNETLVVQATPGSAAAVKVSITAEWEEF